MLQQQLVCCFCFNSGSWHAAKSFQESANSVIELAWRWKSMKTALVTMAADMLLLLVHT
jgi:hypothetical protein